MSPLQNITIEQIEDAAKEFAEDYAPMYQKVARRVFIETMALAQGIDRGEFKLKQP